MVDCRVACYLYLITRSHKHSRADIEKNTSIASKDVSGILRLKDWPSSNTSHLYITSKPTPAHLTNTVVTSVRHHPPSAAQRTLCAPPPPRSDLLRIGIPEDLLCHSVHTTRAAAGRQAKESSLALLYDRNQDRRASQIGRDHAMQSRVPRCYLDKRNRRALMYGR